MGVWKCIGFYFLTFEQICGYATTTDVGGVLKVYFPVSPVAGDYEVLETDYESYAAVWSCVSLGLFHQEIGYLLTRDQVPSEELVNKVKRFQKRNDFLISTDLITQVG